MASDGVTQPWATAQEDGPNRIGALVTVPHDGVVDIDFSARKLTLALRGIDNRAVHAHAMAFDELGIPP